MFLSFVGLLLACLSGGASSVSQAAAVFPTGRLIENLSSGSAPGQRFTVYVPASYDASRPAPIIYLMDPRGRARVPAKLFQAAAERYGYILISSHNTWSDGPIEPNVRAIQAMWDDTHQWFRIDDRRTYLAGFSGTARTASLLARNRPEAITGVIGAGAGFHPDAGPSLGSRFLYFGTVGDVDYNFHEIEALEHSLVSFDLPHRLERFSAPHSWMTPDLATQAVEWMELRAMQSGARPRDEALLDAWWKRDEDRARAWMAGGRPLDAARRYAAMARDFLGLRETAGVNTRAILISSSKEAKAQLKRRQTESRRSNGWVHDAMQAISDAFPVGASTPVLPAADLAGVLELTRMKKTAAGPGEAALEAQRRLNQLEVQLGFYLPHEASESGELTRAAYYLSLAVQIDDASPVAWYMSARIHARLKARPEAFAALRRAMDAGFRDLTAVETDPAFRKLRDDPEYAAIVAVLGSRGDTLDLLKVDRPPLLELR